MNLLSFQRARSGVDTPLFSNPLFRAFALFYLVAGSSKGWGHHEVMAEVCVGAGCGSAECKRSRRYPFVKQTHEFPHADLMPQLKELEAVGYEPHAEDDSYPAAIEAAQQCLADGYRSDCRHSTRRPRQACPGIRTEAGARPGRRSP